MEIIKKLLSEIQQSQSKGQELVIDYYLVGYLIGTGEINSIEEVKILIQQLSEMKNHMDEGKISSFSRDYFISQKLMISGAFSQESSLLIKQQKQQSNDQMIEQDNQYNDDYQKKEQNQQYIPQTISKNQNLEQIDIIKEKNQEYLKQSRKQYNACLQKVVENSKSNKKQN